MEKIKCIDVIASHISKKTIKYTCPNCYSKYKKDGKPYNKAKRLIHKHGSNNNLNNRIEHRSHHKCEGNSDSYDSVNIHITDATIRY